MILQLQSLKVSCFSITSVHDKQHRQRTYNVPFGLVSVTILAVENHYYIFPKSVFVASGIQYAKHTRRIILSSVASLTVPYFCTLSHKQQDFRGEGGGKLANIKCVFRFSLQFV